MPAQRENPTWQAEQPIQIIHLVNLGEDYAAAKIGSRCIHLAIILVTMPVWQVFPDLDSSAQWSSDEPLAELLPQCPQAGMKSQLIAHEPDQPLAFQGLDQCFDEIGRASCRERGEI